MGNCLVVFSSPSPPPPPLLPVNKINLPIQIPVAPGNLKKAGHENYYAFENVQPAVFTKDLEDLRLRQTSSYGYTFTYGEIRAATNNFRPDQILGQGGFGVVYKGVLDETIRPGFKTTQVAVKVLNREGFQGDKEWLTEVNYLGHLSHPNLVKLVGYCCEGTHRLLVYEYMACGSLEKHLFRRVSLTMMWPTRMKIALGAAKGLAFLHGTKSPIIYRDFKTSNILLDEEYNAKLSDFGLAKEGPMGDQTHVSTRVMGTYGYAAPEYVMTGHLSARSDVYGFGVVLLELLIGRKAVDKCRPSREHNLVEWARPLLIHTKKLAKIVDPRLEGQYTNKTLQQIANLAYQCLSQNPKGRPVMREVVETLESLQNLPECRQDYLLFQSCDNAPVTLYEAEVLKENLTPASTANRDRDRDKDKETTAAAAAQGGNKYSSKEEEVAKRKDYYGRRRRVVNEKSKSEPPLATQLESPESDGGLLHPNSTSTD